MRGKYRAFSAVLLVVLDLAVTPATAKISADHYTGAVRIGAAADTCNSSIEDAIRYNTTTKMHEYCDGASWKVFVGISASGAATPPAGSNYFVITNGTFNGNLGGASGADAKCLTDLTSNNWLGKADASGRGVLNSTHVKAWFCPSTSCQNGIANTTYYFAVSGDATLGGAYFTTDAGGLGTGNTQNWSGSNYFNGSKTYWTGFDNATTNTSWGGISGGSATEVCYDGSNGGNWTNLNGGTSGGVVGISASSDVGRWNVYLNTCDTLNHLVCFVNP